MKSDHNGICHKKELRKILILLQLLSPFIVWNSIIASTDNAAIQYRIQFIYQNCSNVVLMLCLMLCEL